ncbi:uncharacterized protein EI97DRAFT_413562 [Westerdykella ornata]|uniref:Uncharacterized protein n=1 Tax=Westerdykella ornata TaxID=318751 RepID=A0A6A6JRK9_WESOR|nr:uncharacterized protein EI97DRAFT_413562 [Westerdykella ornata]KAF2278753.1 hypothetical protein EI97DRAFT_413562 [Westerdykella ornata]
MHVPTVFLSASAALVSLAAAGQVNFYSDTNCQSYIGSSYPGGNGVITGGPAGSFSALWVTADQTTCSHTCGPLNICGDSQCNRRRETGIGRCVSFNTGVWARNGCNFNFCSNAKRGEKGLRESKREVKEDGFPEWKREEDGERFPPWMVWRKEGAGDKEQDKEDGSPDWKREDREDGAPDWKREDKEDGAPDWKREEDGQRCQFRCMH